jgi:prolyl 4-hydroxylase
MSIAAATQAAYANKWDEALALLRGAATAGDEYARGQLVALSGLDAQTIAEPPAKERIHDQSAIFVCRGFAPAALCDWLIERAQSRVAPAYVNDARTGEIRVDPTRTAHSIGVDYDVVSAMMQERAARLTRVPVTHHEPPNVISYEVGQKFDYHHDYLDPEQTALLPVLLAYGQRTITIVTYLNTAFEGAATDFPRLGIAFKGGKGDAIVFSNVRPDGTPDANTWHAGLPPTAGRKWVLSQWIRNRAPPRARS